MDSLYCAELLTKLRKNIVENAVKKLLFLQDNKMPLNSGLQTKTNNLFNGFRITL